MKYAISDIHGCAKTFRKLVEDVLALSKSSDELYLLGDYVDRGPDSKGVLDYIMQLKADGYQMTVIRGNHDQLLFDAVHNQDVSDNWTMNGGASTLLSFKVDQASEIPPEYYKLIGGMEYYAETESAFLVHAGFNFKAPNVFEDYNSMMYIRNMSIDNSIIGYKKIVHGHTPIPLSDIRRAVDSGEQELNIDNGCVFGAVEEYGNLVALNLENFNIITQPYID